MKTATIRKYRSPAPEMLPYPSAATKREIMDRLIDKLLVAAIGVGSASSMLLILALF